VGDLLSRIEIAKLAHELRAPAEDLAFLSERTPGQLRDLRAAVSDALFARHEERVRRLATLSGLLPVPVTARIAELALGPLLSARVAGALDPRAAARLAGHLSPDFLARLAVALDPRRVAPIVTALPDDLVVAVGTRLLAEGEHLVLGRFVSVVDERVALAVVDRARPEQLLQAALHTEEPAALDGIVRRLDDSTIAGIITAAADADAYDAAVTLLTALSADSCARVVAQVDAVAAQHRSALVAAVAEHDVWPQVLPALGTLARTTLAGLVNVPVTLDPELIDRVVDHARSLDLAPVLVEVVLALDDAHLDILQGSRTLQDAETRAWLLDRAGVSRRLVEAVLGQLGP
jgi:hypothetical protein